MTKRGIAMISFTIDPSVAAFPPFDSDQLNECENIRKFSENILALWKVKNSSSVTVSYPHKFSQRLKEAGLGIPKPENYKQRINGVKASDRLPSKEIEEFINSLCRMNGSGIYKCLKEPTPNRLGVFFDYKIFLKENRHLYKNFKNYLEYLARLNHSYRASGNYLVLGGSFNKIEKVNLSLSISSNVKIIGIQDAVKLGQIKTNFKNLAVACKKAKGKSGKRLVFGADVTDRAIMRDIQPAAGPPELVYLYLRTLSNIARIIAKHSLSIKDNDELAKMLNAHGLLCSPDSGHYHKYQCKNRVFEDGTGKTCVFNVHLKPSTYKYDDGTLASSMTVRIYLKWDNSEKVIKIGWIGKHPIPCKKGTEILCPHYDECRGKNPQKTV
jgi:hypothetical protein